MKRQIVVVPESEVRVGDLVRVLHYWGEDGGMLTGWHMVTALVPDHPMVPEGFVGAVVGKRVHEVITLYPDEEIEVKRIIHEGAE